VFAKVTEGLDVLKTWGAEILQVGSIGVQMQEI
jgi:hypothetical protein